jgi:dTDP-4-dehydrorhamnose 3,5-epimerase
LRFTPLPLEGAYVVTLEPISDKRGFNARAWCEREFAEAGLPTRTAQINIISNRLRGTLRGMHYQAPPMTESKLFRVTRGAIYDVIVDLRRGSPTCGQWTSVELHADRYQLLFVPERVAQGFQTLYDDTELTYQVSQFYSPEHGRGFRYDDPAFGIDWPLPVTEISEKDRAWPDHQSEDLL